MNLDEYKAFVLAQRKENAEKAISAILQATKKEGAN
jgi:hypothetical protein